MMSPPEGADLKKVEKKRRDSDAEMMDEASDLKPKDPKDQQDKDDKKELPPDSQSNKDNDKKEDSQKPDASTTEISHPQVKLTTKENDAEMLKPAEVSDSENIEDSEAPKDKKKQGDPESSKKGDDEKKALEEKDKVEDLKKDVPDESGLFNFFVPNQIKSQDKTKSDIELERKRDEQELIV